MTKPLGITDTTFRDAHQSLMATRLRTEDMVPIAKRMNAIGFHSMEVWGGATFDSSTRFLGEDPWSRLRVFKELMPDTPLQMLLRGQSLVGYRPYADDVVDAFIERSAENGIDIFRVFDALNDKMNLERAASAVKRSGKHLQMTICYSVTEEGKMGGDIYNLNYYLQKVEELLRLGADSICVKDMAGLLAPYDAFELFTALRDVVDLPLQLHTHYTSGMASMTTMKAIEAGVDTVDTCLAPLALRTAQPAIEPLLTTLRGSDRDPKLELEAILEVGDQLELILPKYKQYFDTRNSSVIDARVLSHQIPGGMTSNLVSQLQEADALERLPEVLEEIPKTRKDLGYPPLVTPMSQMVGSQSVTNVLMGRYSVINEQVKEYAYGLYGTPPTPMDPDVASKALAAYSRGESPITGRPPEWTQSELPLAMEAISGLSGDIDDGLIYALYPTTGEKFLRIKHGYEPMPDEMKSPKPESIVEAKSSSPKGSVSSKARKFNVYIDDEVFEVFVDSSSNTVDGATQPSGIKAPNTPSLDADSSNADVLLESPLPGLLLRYAVEEGQEIKEGEPVVVIEAMKMENSLPSPVSGTVKSLPFETGVKVARADILATITPNTA